MSGGMGSVTSLRSLRRLSGAATVLLGLVGVVDVAAVVTHLLRASALSELDSGSVEGQLAEVNDATGAVDAADVLHMLAFVAIAAVFITWQWRHARNAQVLGARGRFAPGWAIGGWFVPIGNFVIPAVELSQSSTASDTHLYGSAPARRAARILPWAMAFGLGGVLWTFGTFTTPDSDAEGHLVIRSAEDVGQARASDLVAAAGFVCFATAAVLAIVMVRTLTTRQLAAAPLPAEPPSLVGGEAEPQPARPSRYDRDLDESLQTGVWRWSTNVRRWGWALIALCSVCGAAVVLSQEPDYMIWWLGVPIVVWLVFWPRVQLSDGGVHIRNLYRRAFIRWADIARVEVDNHVDAGRRLFVHTTNGDKVRVMVGDHSLPDLWRRNRSDVLAGEVARRAADIQCRPAEALGGPHRYTGEERAELKKRAVKRGVMAAILAAIVRGDGS